VIETTTQRAEDRPHNMPFVRSARRVRHLLHRYSRTASVTERMLRNMFIGDPPGNTPHPGLLDRRTGGKFFTPTVDFLNDPPPLADST